MDMKLIELLRVVLSKEINQNNLTPEAAEFCIQAMISILSIYEKHDEFIKKIQLDFLHESMSWEELKEEMLQIENKSAINQRRLSKYLDKLIKRGVLEEVNCGIKLSHPLHHFPYHIITEKGEEYFRKSINFLLSNKIMNMLGLTIPLKNRQVFMYDASLTAGKESCFIFSKSPTIFDPFISKSDDTEDFAKSMENAEEIVYYVWNLDTVLTQIRDHLKSSGLNEQQLRESYFAHFSRYAGNQNIKVFVGDNSPFTAANSSCAYISDSKIIKGVRIDGSLVGGFAIMRRRIIELCDKLPTSFLEKLGKLTSGIGLDLYAGGTCEALRTDLDYNPQFIKLKQHDDKSIKMFIDNLFDLAKS